MSMKTKITAAACAGALALAGVVPAFAADETTINKEGSAEVAISASVAKSGEDIISVTVPSRMAVAITTNSAADAGKTVGTFKSATAASATVTNNAVSTKSVKVTVDKVAQRAGVDSRAKLLDLVKVNLLGDSGTSVSLAESTANAPLFDSIAPNGSQTLGVEVLAKDESTKIPNDTYTVLATLKVTAVTI